MSEWAVRFLTLLTGIAIGSCAADAEPQTYYRATVCSVHDGDTATMDIDLWPKLKLGFVTVRAADFDAWESTRARIQVDPFRSFSAAQWSDEIDRGLRARDELRELLTRGQVFITPDAKPDPYGRLLAKWYVYRADELVSVAEFMRAKGHVRIKP